MQINNGTRHQQAQCRLKCSNGCHWFRIAVGTWLDDVIQNDGWDLAISCSTSSVHIRHRSIPYILNPTSFFKAYDYSNLQCMHCMHNVSYLCYRLLWQMILVFPLWQNRPEKCITWQWICSTPLLLTTWNIDGDNDNLIVKYIAGYTILNFMKFCK